MENVMMNSLHTQIKIVDFGLGNFWRSDRALRTHCGSPEYAAPELFITGRKFGPEVDLWSFGVILYGMVIGQLPFISSKGEHISSQERRKRLVAQINKGLSTQHQRAIAYCSSDFRNLMNKLLIADISKRITIKELIQHPWITENGTKMIRTNSIITIDIQEFAKIVNNISALLRTDVDLILDSVKKKPFNKIGGIYNILVYKHAMGIFGNLQFSNEEINSTKFNVERRQLSNRRNKNVVEKVCPSSAPVKIPNIPHSPYIQQLGEKVKKSNNYDNNKNIPNDDLKNKLLQNATRFYYKKQCNKLQEENNGKHNEESSINQNVDYRSIKSPSLRRKAYSASISTRTKSQTGTSEKCKYIFHKNNIVNDEINDKTKIIMQSNENAPKQIEKNFTEVLTTKYTKKSRPATSTYVPLEKSKCEPRKKYTICGVPQHTAERLLKRFSSTPANCTNTISKTYKEKQDGKIARQMIASTQTCGDGFPLQTNKNIKRKFDQDPIARSIAGYMVHNIPSDTLK